jgi:hypothetical protein
VYVVVIRCTALFLKLFIRRKNYAITYIKIVKIPYTNAPVGQAMSAAADVQGLVTIIK